MSNLLPKFFECLDYAFYFLNWLVFLFLVSTLTRIYRSGNHFMWWAKTSRVVTGPNPELGAEHVNQTWYSCWLVTPGSPLASLPYILLHSVIIFVPEKLLSMDAHRRRVLGNDCCWIFSLNFSWKVDWWGKEKILKNNGKYLFLCNIESLLNIRTKYAFGIMNFLSCFS